MVIKIQPLCLDSTIHQEDLGVAAERNARRAKNAPANELGQVRKGRTY